MPPAPRPHRSLSVRLLVLVVSVLLLVDAAFFTAVLQHERARWLQERLSDAELVVLAVGPTGNVMPARSVRAAIERLSGVEQIRVLRRSGPETLLAPTLPPPPTRLIDVDHESWLQGLVQAVPELVPQTSRRLRVVGTTAIGNRLELLVPQARLTAKLRLYALRFVVFSVTVALVVGALLFVTLRAMLVLPLRRISANIAAFRADPERVVPLDPAGVTPAQGDEISALASALSSMQAELGTALWRNARLAAVGMAVAKMSHDLRGILSSALLVADRLTMSREDNVRQAGEVIVRAVHRATSLAQRTLDFVREGPPALVRTRMALHPLVEEAAAAACGQSPRSCTVHNELDEAAAAQIDHDAMLRVLTNLFRNAVQAGAHTLTVTSTGQDAATIVTVADDGPGLPAEVQQGLFRPFAPSRSGGSGLGMAIARDLMWAHGGDLKLADTGAQGTRFMLYFQQPPRDDG